MENKVTYGLEDVHIAFMNPASLAPPEWETPEAIPGAVRFTPNPQGQESTFYADNEAYFVVSTNDGYKAELEMALIPDAIKARILGWEIDSNGMLVEVADGTPEPFALLGQVLGDKKNRRFVYYNNIASRPTQEHRTRGESVTPDTEVLSITVTPIEIAGKNIVKGVLPLTETNKTKYDAFFGSVLLPAFETGA